jgi:hypothetical protein
MATARPTLRGACAFAAIAILPALVPAQELKLPRDHHPWGSFPVGSWKLVRTTSETLDADGRVTGVTVTDTRTSLTAADENAYTLRSEIAVDVTGRRIATTPQVVKHGYYGEPPGQGLSVKRIGEAPLNIDGRQIVCELRQLIFEEAGAKRISTLHYSADVAPFVLRRETSLDNGSDEKRNSSLVEVIALDLPQRIRGELKQASYVKTTQKLAHGTRVTLEVHCEDVPGGVAAHWASETDASGNVIRRTTLELIGYGLPATTSGTSIALPRRANRKAARRMDQR